MTWLILINRDSPIMDIVLFVSGVDIMASLKLIFWLAVV